MQDDRRQTRTSTDVSAEQEVQPDPALALSEGRAGKWRVAATLGAAAAVIVLLIYGMNSGSPPAETSSTPPSATANVPPADSAAEAPLTSNPADQKAQKPAENANTGNATPDKAGDDAATRSTQGEKGQEQSNQPALESGRSDSSVGKTDAAPQPPAQ